MSIFVNKYPYSDFHELNLDWILETVSSLEKRVAVLEEKLSGFAGDMEQTIKDLIKSYLTGTENEIKITEADDKLKIGFDDNAIFGEI